MQGGARNARVHASRSRSPVVANVGWVMGFAKPPPAAQLPARQPATVRPHCPPSVPEHHHVERSLPQTSSHAQTSDRHLFAPSNQPPHAYARCQVHYHSLAPFRRLFVPPNRPPHDHARCPVHYHSLVVFRHLFVRSDQRLRACGWLFGAYGSGPEHGCSLAFCRWAASLLAACGFYSASWRVLLLLLLRRRQQRPQQRLAACPVYRNSPLDSATLTAAAGQQRSAGPQTSAGQQAAVRERAPSRQQCPDCPPLVPETPVLETLVPEPLNSEALNPEALNPKALNPEALKLRGGSRGRTVATRSC